MKALILAMTLAIASAFVPALAETRGPIVIAPPLLESADTQTEAPPIMEVAALQATGPLADIPAVMAPEPIEPSPPAPAARKRYSGKPSSTVAAKTESLGAFRAVTGKTSEPVRIALLLTLLALVPAIAMCMTPFVRIIVVLSMIRHAFGMPETPPNQVLVILALFLTTFVMMPTFTRVNDVAVQPFMGGQIELQEALDRGAQPLREFMLRQVHDSDIATVYNIGREPLPKRAADVGTMQLTSAFMLNELRVSFKIGFVIFLPFLLIDLVVSSVLLSLGMLMVPPTTLSLPIKILMFVLIDGWSLILEGVVGSFR